MTSVSDLSVTIGKRQILHGIDFPTLEPGQFVGLIGPNASGKSTLLRTISLGSKYQGTVTVDDRDVVRLRRKERSKLISMMPQTPPLGSTLSPFELLRSYARAIDLGLGDQALEIRISDLLGNLGLMPDAHRPMAELSGGKRQLVGLCLAMIREPALLLLDEPTSALDLRWQLTALGVARSYVKSRDAIGIAALHDINLALRFCDLLVVLKEGHLAACGPPREVVTPALVADVYGVAARMESCSEGYPFLIADAAS
jgi:iron complex transport system ATP-binding protein